MVILIYIPLLAPYLMVIPGNKIPILLVLREIGNDPFVLFMRKSLLIQKSTIPDWKAVHMICSTTFSPTIASRS